MRGLPVFTLITTLALGHSFASAATPPKPVQNKAPVELIESEPPDHVYPLVLAAGAMAGVLTVNWMTYGVGNIPLYVGMETTAPMVSPAAAAASRIFVITSGVIGAWIADVLYR
ncbi:exported hypothetical protein [Gammaproteobacteria bacterium]